eukprot:TRINITY_DN92170_c0_g1_i1.p1 TRINITY_DN92170_c0_g1~~TRINITY_DN92170_c0_g1_i1.p1  ORF type:complete len:282 (-),score=47.76 TRINITY_DN92170_c0_g1_i1:260-1042(-)
MAVPPVQAGMDARTPMIVDPSGASPALQQAYSIMDQVPHARLQQVIRKRDMCCDFNNYYLIKDPQGVNLFFLKENSTCIERNCCSGECKAWRMDMYHLPNGFQGVESVGEPFLHLERPFSCTCLCLNRPQVYVSEFPSGNALGMLEDPFACCRLNTTVTEPGTALPILKADATICQPGMFCAWPCLNCKVDFPISDTTTGQPVAHLTKHWTWGDICRIGACETSTLDLEFGNVQSARYKMLLLATSVFVQMAFFDVRNQQ